MPPVTISTVFLVLLAVDAAINVAASANEEKNRKIIYATKPLLMPLLILYYVTGAGSPDWLVVAALFFGFCGDVFLMLPGEKEKFFMGGLGSFLVNQVLYVVIFFMSIKSYGAIPAWLYALIAVFAAYGALMYSLIHAKLGSMMIPVIVYMLCILGMGVGALLRAVDFSGPAYWLVLAGAVTFIASDSVLACDRFRARLAVGKPIVMATYIGAQAMIVQGLMS